MAAKMFKKIFWVTKDGEEYEEIDEELYEEYEHPIEREENIGQIALDILDDGDRFIILAPVAWVDLKDIDLSFYNQVLTISWVRKKPEIYFEDVIIKNKECYWGKFSRKIILPENLDFDRIEADIDNNMLIIRIPKLHFTNNNIKINRV